MWELSRQHCGTVSIIFSFWRLSSMNCQCFPQQRAPCLPWLWLRCVSTLSSTEQLQCKLAQCRANTRAHNRGSPQQSHKRVWRNLTCKLKINKSDCKSWKPKRNENQIPSPLGRKKSKGEELSQFSGQKVGWACAGYFSYCCDIRRTKVTSRKRSLFQPAG